MPSPKRKIKYEVKKDKPAKKVEETSTKATTSLTTTPEAQASLQSIPKSETLKTTFIV
jgi:hypothetical protein